MAEEVGFPNHTPLPAMPVTARASRELRPRRPLEGDPRHWELAISNRPVSDSEINRGRLWGLRTGHRQIIAKMEPVGAATTV